MHGRACVDNASRPGAVQLGPRFARDLVSLTRLLKCAADQVQTNRDFLNQYKRIASGKSGANCSSKGGRIPKKARFADQRDTEPGDVSPSEGSKKKECDHCAQWKSQVRNTHWTKDCKIFEADGSCKPRRNGSKRGGIRGHKSITMLLKDQNKEHKKARCKRRCREGGYASLSSSSSSDSE